jgi:CMP-N-acetylneuraminic acid synthetase
MLSVATLAVIPARAGSRGLPGKHLARIGGIPMIVHTIRAGQAARSIDRVLISTNDPVVARVARRAGAEVLSRPDELGQDDSATLPVIQHALRQAEADGQRFELVVTLQPTAPLREAAEIDAAVRLLDDSSVQSAVSVTHLDQPISVVGWLTGSRFHAAGPRHDADVRRQVSAPAVRVTGGIYVTRRSLLERGRLLDDQPAALVVPQRSAIDVDTPDHLRAARRAWRRRPVTS